MKHYFLSLFVWIFYRLLSITWRFQVIEPNDLVRGIFEKKPIIFAHWHGDELVLIHLVRRYKTATIVSTSKDGELMDNILRRQGGKNSRGSSSKKAIQGLKGLIRLMKAGHPASLAVDGPKGPIHKVKPGVFELSRISHAPIFVAGCSCDRAWHFPKSWNKTYLPKPFAKVIVKWEGPIGPIGKQQDPRDENLLNNLAESLHQAGQRAKEILS